MESWKIVVIIFFVLLIIYGIIVTTILLTKDNTDKKNCGGPTSGTSGTTSGTSGTRSDMTVTTFAVQLSGPFERAKSKGFGLESYGLRWDAQGKHVDVSRNELVDLKRDEVYTMSPHGSQFVQKSNVINMRVGDTLQLYRPVNSTYKTYIRTRPSTNGFYDVDDSMVRNQGGGHDARPVEFSPSEPGEFYYCDNDDVDLCGVIFVI